MKLVDATIAYMQECMEGYEQETQEEESELLRDAYAGIISEYKVAIIALKYMKKEINLLSRVTPCYVTEKEMIERIENYADGVFVESEKE